MNYYINRVDHTYSRERKTRVNI